LVVTANWGAVVDEFVDWDGEKAVSETDEFDVFGVVWLVELVNVALGEAEFVACDGDEVTGKPHEGVDVGEILSAPRTYI